MYANPLVVCTHVISILIALLAPIIYPSIFPVIGGMIDFFGFLFPLVNNFSVRSAFSDLIR